MGANAPEVVNTPQTRENLRQLIAQWNANRLDLFEISEPNEVIIIFYFNLKIVTYYMVINKEGYFPKTCFWLVFIMILRQSLLQSNMKLLYLLP